MRCYAFTCPHCEFMARVCGTVDHAANCFSITFVCHDCRTLYDLATHVRLPASLALKNRARDGTLQSRSPRTLEKPEFNSIVPENVHVGEIIINTRPTLPQGLLPHNTSLRWVELAPRCPVAAFHKIEPWTHPGRCPRCQIHLDRSLLPFRTMD